MSSLSIPIANAVSGLFEGISGAFGEMFGSALPSYFELETSDAEHRMVTKTGAFVSGIRIKGLPSAVGSEEYEQIATDLIRLLEAGLSKPGQAIDVVAYCDPDGGHALVEQSQGGARDTAQRINAQLDDVFDSRRDTLGKLAMREGCLMAIWTSPELLSTSAAKSATKGRQLRRKAAPRMPGPGQDLLAALPELRERHEGLVSSLYHKLQSAGFIVERLSSHEIVREVRMAIDADSTPANWRPSLPGDKIPLVCRRPDTLSLDVSDVQYPPLAWQVFQTSARRDNATSVTIGQRSYAPMMMTVPPATVMPFQSLFDALSAERLPWRVRVRLDGGGMSFLGAKPAVASLLKWAGSENSQISNAVEAMKAVVDEGNVAVRLRVAFSTWAPANKPDLLRERQNKVREVVASWGNCELGEVSGDPLAGLMSTIPFATSKHIGVPAIPPLADAVRFLPIIRPASVWTSGSIVYRTTDGKLMPFHPGSDLQNTWVYIMVARPGSGKSVQMLGLLLAAAFAPGQARLPRISVVDIGPSAEALVMMIKESLPPALRHQATAFKLRNLPEYAINPFDLPLGMRRPTKEHQAFLVNLLSLIATPAEEPRGFSSMSQLCATVIEQLYERFDDNNARGEPKLYNLAQCDEVDALLTQYGFHFDRNTTWWSIVDFLFGKGHVHEAMLAQRYAVPVLSDAIGQASNQAINKVYGQVRVSTGESLPEAFSRLAMDASSEFPIFTLPTRFDIGDVRVSAINLEEVAKTGSATADRQTALMYMLATYVLTKEYRLDKDILPEVPRAYREFHSARIADLREDQKWIAYDEFHRLRNSPAAQDAVERDIREGRKYKIGVILSSQDINDFPEGIRQFITGAWILGAANEKASYALRDYFGFSDSTRELLVSECNGPIPGVGAPFIGWFATKRGSFSQLYYATMGAVESWALTTTRDDVLVREKVCSVLGGPEGRRALGRLFPRGAQSEIQRMRLEDGDVNPVGNLSDKVLGEARKLSYDAR